MLARRPAGGLAALAGAREGPEVQSAPAGPLKSPPADSRRRSGLYSDGHLRMKRKAAADADEASSGTTGHTHPEVGAGTTAGGPFKVRARAAAAGWGAHPAAVGRRWSSGAGAHQPCPHPRSWHHSLPAPPPLVPQRQESLRARSARASPHGAAAAPVDDHMGGGAQDENAAQLLLAIGKQ